MPPKQQQPPVEPIPRLLHARDREHHRHMLLDQLLSCYASDSRFRKGLETLSSTFFAKREDLRAAFAVARLYDHVEWQLVVEEVAFADADFKETGIRTVRIRTVRDRNVRTYERAVRRVVGRWGLDRLPFDRGYRAVHEWLCCWLADQDYAPDDFGRVPFNPIARDTPHDMTFTEGGVALPVVVELSPWRFRSELPAEAKKRLHKEAYQLINAEIDRLAARLEAGRYATPKEDKKAGEEEREWQPGLIFPRDRKEMKKHLGWLYRRLAYRESVQEIAREQSAARTVRQQTDSDRKLLGLPRFPAAEEEYTP